MCGLAAQIDGLSVLYGFWVWRNPPNVMGFDTVDYDARKVFTYL